jgi:hypothetical protein
LGEFLSPKPQFNAEFALLSDRFTQSPQQKRQAARNAFGRDFTKPFFELIQTSGQNPFQVGFDLWMPSENQLNVSAVPDQCVAFFHRAGCTGLNVAETSGMHANCISTTNQPENDLIPV